jgi:LCP family protein required for cell wall assembly
VADQLLPPELNPRGNRRPARRPAGRSGGRRSWRGFARTTALVLSVCVLGASGVLYTRYLHFDHNISRITGAITKTGGVKAVDGAENVLLVGSDSRSGAGDGFAQAPAGQTQVEGARSDTVILAHLAKGGQAATLVSLPRDSWVTIPAYTDAQGAQQPAHEDKLNAAFSLGGPALLINTVQQLTGVHIDHYVEIDFAGFQNMVNALGGVDICLSQPAHDVQTGLNLTAGDHHLDGATALEFVRQRYGLPLGDIDRIKRQQQFLGSMLRKVESAGTLTNPVALNSFLDALTKSITVDSSMSTSDLTQLALKLKGLGSGDVVLTTLPLSGFSTQDGADVDDIDVAKMDALFASLNTGTSASASASASATATPTPTPLTVAPGAVQVEVFNGAGIKGLAARASADLKKAGFDVVGTPADRGNGAAESLVEYGPTEVAAAQTLLAAVPGSTLQPEPQLGSTLQLVVGESYTGAVTPGSAAAASASASASASAAGATATTAANVSCTD